MPDEGGRGVEVRSNAAWGEAVMRRGGDAGVGCPPSVELAALVLSGLHGVRVSGCHQARRYELGVVAAGVRMFFHHSAPHLQSARSCCQLTTKIMQPGLPRWLAAFGSFSRRLPCQLPCKLPD